MLILASLLFGGGCGGHSEPMQTTTARSGSLDIVFNWVAMRSAERDSLILVSPDGRNGRALGSPRPTGSGRAAQEAFEFGESNGAWSPDGRTLAFEGRRHTYSDDTSRDGLYVMNVDRSRRRRLVAGNIDDPAWAPDGRRIAFAMGPPGNQAIHVWQARDVRRLTGFVGATRPTWSRDGTKIAYERWRSWDYGAGIFERPSLYVMDAGGSNTRRLGFGGAPDWSPVRDEIVVWDCTSCPQVRARQTFVVDADGSGRRLIAGRKVEGANDWLAAWSPDGAQIVFVSNRDGSGEEIWVMNADGSNAGALTGNHPDDYSQHADPDWRRGPD